MSNDPYANVDKVKLPKVQPRGEEDAKLPSEDVEGYSTRISSETKKGLQELAKAMQEANEEVSEPEEVEEDDDDDGKVDLGAHSEEVAKKYTSIFYRNTPIDNPDIRAQIESKCSDLDFEDLILTGRVLQRVPIMGKLTVTFQSLKAKDVMWLEREASKIENEFEARTWIGYARLCASVASVNKKIFEDHIGKQGDLSPKKFKSKFTQIMNLNERLIEVMLVNLNWFEDRVSRLFSNDFDQLKNG